MPSPHLSAIYKISDPERRALLAESIRAVEQQDISTETVVCVPTGASWATAVDADRILPVSSPALTVARNRGARVSTGEHIAFIDDDARPSMQWADGIHAGFVDKDADAVGGPLVPDWRGDELPWLPQTWHWLIGCGPYYDDPQWVPNTYGSNFVVRREAFDAVDGFDESIGMGSGGVGQGAETDLARRLRKAGFDAVWYEPDARMYHVIRPDRLDPLGLLRRAYEQGRAKAALGLGGRESRFVRDELAATRRRSIRASVVAAVLTATVAAGLVRERISPTTAPHSQ